MIKWVVFHNFLANIFKFYFCNYMRLRELKSLSLSYLTHSSQDGRFEIDHLNKAWLKKYINKTTYLWMMTYIVSYHSFSLCHFKNLTIFIIACNIKIRSIFITAIYEHIKVFFKKIALFFILYIMLEKGVYFQIKQTKN